MDYLVELCAKFNIELIYTDDDYTALSACTNGKKVSINADKIFRECPEKVAKAVMGYYTESGNEDSYLKTIKNYIHDNIVTVEYTIEPPDDEFKGVLLKHTGNGALAEVKTPEDGLQKSTIPGKRTSRTKTPGTKTSVSNTSEGKASGSKTSGGKTAKGSASKAGTPNDSTSSLVELKIASMTKKSFYGGAVEVSPKEAIKVSSDDVVELDIEIDDSEF